MIRRFRRNESGQYAMMTAILAVPLLGALAFAVDFTEMNRQRVEVLNALDAAGIATARRVITGATDAELVAAADRDRTVEVDLEHLFAADGAAFLVSQGGHDSARRRLDHFAAAGVGISSVDRERHPAGFVAEREALDVAGW